MARQRRRRRAPNAHPPHRTAPPPRPMATFSVTNEQLGALVDPKSPDRLEALGGLAGLLRALKTDSKRGVPAAEAADGFSARRAHFGRNALPEGEHTTFFGLVWEGLQDKTLIMLIVSAGVSLVLGIRENPASGWIEGTAILVAVLVVVMVSALNDYSKEQQFRALNAKKDNKDVKVVRGGEQLQVSVYEINVGDIVTVETGDIIPADGVYVSGHGIKCDESGVTGESDSIAKPDDDPFFLSGTQVLEGYGLMVVIAVGPNSIHGKTMMSLRVESEDTPLQGRLDKLADQIGHIGLGMAVITLGSLIIKHIIMDFSHARPLFSVEFFSALVHYVITAVTMVVVAVPEGLPLAVTMALAYSMMKMLDDNNLVRHLSACETMGGATTICSDKTGTLTTNKMSVSKLFVFDTTGAASREYDIEGSSFAPTGDISLNGARVEKPCDNSVVLELAKICALCNDASVSYNPDKKTYENVGEPTEAALKVLVEKLLTDDAGFNKSVLSENAHNRVQAVNKHYEAQFDKVATLEFSRDRKSMSVLLEAKDKTAGVSTRSGKGGRNVMFVKGAPEAILERCTFVRLPGGKTVDITDDFRRAINAKVLEWGTGMQTLRCLGLATVDNAKDKAQYDLVDSNKFCEYEKNMTFVGLVGMLDPPRPEVAKSIETCRSAGIRVIVITGDNKNTAEAICRRIGVFAKDEDLSGKSFTGREYDDLTDAQKDEAVKTASLFSRTEPSHKMELVKRLQAQGEICAMTGDGVNDAPALKKADIGVAMGSGTAVAKEAADMVLADDNFATIVTAVEEGRSIFNNTKQFIRYLISSNIGEVVCIFLTVLLGTPEALIPVQLLWVNLVTDGLPATALGFNPPDLDIMMQPPRKADESIVNGWLFFRYIVIGTYVGLATVGGYIYWFMFYEHGPHVTFYQLSHFHSCEEEFAKELASGLTCGIFTGTMAETASTVSLSILVTIEMFNAFNSLSENQSLFSMPPWVNPYLIGATALSMALHFAILYVPFLGNMFSIEPLNWDEWMIVLAFSFPVIILDEFLKFISRATARVPGKVKTH
eukprot:Unigene4852_Nuclearia_a/m.14844 Unigene4852_Nuclearia_a/g.14844  ORF Unigene4852_Nuclearia_a/g.14844 Unigene4852_Nuclearia_a/m.14844 type:complete len:1054 (-) Unigene4852_Nuclearia_a:149-3310(-)